MFTSIVTGTDGSPTADFAMRQAFELARRFGAHIHLVNVARQASPFAKAAPELAAAVLERDDAERDWATSSLSDLATELDAEGMTVTTHRVAGDPAEAIVRVAEEVRADLIVVGNRGMRGARRVLGSVPNSVSHHAPCSVLIIRTT